MTAQNLRKWVDCGCCGRTHEDHPGDCRAFTVCPKCGDGYHLRNLSEHVESCKGVAASEQPNALFVYDDDVYFAHEPEATR